MQINNHNTNGILNSVHTRYNNNHHLNNNNINNNDVNHHTHHHHHHAAYNNSNSVSFESQNNSENHNHSTTTNAYRSASSSQRNSYRGDNYPTTSEGSSSPESSSDSSEEWESGELLSFFIFLIWNHQQKKNFLKVLIIAHITHPHTPLFIAFSNCWLLIYLFFFILAFLIFWGFYCEITRFEVTRVWKLF